MNRRSNTIKLIMAFIALFVSNIAVSQTLHGIIFADTHSDDIGSSVKKDFGNLEIEFNLIAAATNMKLTKDEKQYLSVASTSMYCQGCRICDGQCPKGLPIPEMMRAYMYNYGYGSPALAREVIDELALTGDLCNDCAVCTVRCTAGFKVAQKVKDITRLQYVPQEFLA